MKKQETELFKSLCSFRSEGFNEELLESATPLVLGHLFFNRMQAIAYAVLKSNNLLGKVNREFRNSLKAAHEQSTIKNSSFFWCVNYVGKLLASCNCKYALLKGAYLCKAYPEGCRTSNDIDLLVSPEYVTVIGTIMSKAGFKQGNIRNGEFVSATRKEIIESKMMRGETVPYIKEVGLPGMKYLEIDINFSLDYKPGDTTILKDMLDNSVSKEVGDLKVRTLRDDDFFIHLCCHLYKEATTLPWVEMMRDMTLYKYADIYTLLSDMSDADVDRIFERASKTGTDKICAFAVLQTNELFNLERPHAVERAKSVLTYDPYFIHTIISPKDKKRYLYTEKNIEKRFFADSRRNLLEEVL